MTAGEGARLRTAPPASGLLAVALGGALGALTRSLLGEAWPDGGGFPWTTFAINVAGSFALGALPALAVARRRPVVAQLLGSGFLGGFTTLSLYAEQARALAAGGSGATALAYLGGTLLACLLAVVLADRLSTPAQRRRFVEEEGDR